MPDVTLIAIDIATNAFQLHGVTATGAGPFLKKLSRGQLLAFCRATSRHWSSWKPVPQPIIIPKLGHDIRLIPPIYVKPSAKHQKNDANAAETIAETAARLTMRFFLR